MNVQTEMKSSRKYEKYLYVKSQYKVNFMNCRKYRHKGKDFYLEAGTRMAGVEEMAMILPP